MNAILGILFSGDPGKLIILNHRQIVFPNATGI